MASNLNNESTSTNSSQRLLPLSEEKEATVRPLAVPVHSEESTPALSASPLFLQQAGLLFSAPVNQLSVRTTNIGPRNFGVLLDSVSVSLHHSSFAVQ